jgi:phasin family protein
MFSNPKQFTSATQALFESQIAAFHALGNQAAAGVEKAIALNIAANQACVETPIAAAKQLASAKDPQEFFSLSAAQAKPAADTVTSYGRDFAEIATGMWAEFMNVAETQLEDAKNQITAMVDDVTVDANIKMSQAAEIR